MLRRLFGKFFKSFSNDIGVDLGTANTLVYVRGQGIVINEPSVVAINQKTGRVVAIGHEAKHMLGRTPGHIIAIRPLTEGVISDFEVAEEMLSYLLGKAEGEKRKIMGPRVVIGVPSGITEVETRAVRDAVKNAGARQVLIVEEPMAGAIGIHLPVKNPVGNMIIDIGGGTTDMAIISLEGIVRSKNLRVAGGKFDSDIVAYIRNQFKILIGEKTAEHLKISIGSVYSGKESLEMPVRGRDLMTGLPREVTITDADIREAISQSVETIIEAAKEMLEGTPPEILSDIVNRGLYLIGGGALLRGLPELLAESLKVSIHVDREPLTAVARGTGIILEHLSEFEGVLKRDEDELPLKNN